MGRAEAERTKPSNTMIFNKESSFKINILKILSFLRILKSETNMKFDDDEDFLLFQIFRHLCVGLEKF